VLTRFGYAQEGALNNNKIRATRCLLGSGTRLLAPETPQSGIPTLSQRERPSVALTFKYSAKEGISQGGRQAGRQAGSSSSSRQQQAAAAAAAAALACSAKKCSVVADSGARLAWGLGWGQALRSHARQESARSHASQVMPARSQSTRSHANQLVMVHLLCVVPAKKTCKE